MGRADYLKLGDWNAICDRCGFKFKASELRETWDHLRVCKKCWEPRHISDFYKVEADKISVPWTRPEQAASSGTTVTGSTTSFLGVTVEVGDASKTLTIGTDPEVQIWNEALTANRTITLATSGAEKLDRFIIYRTAADGVYELQTDTSLFPYPALDFKAEVEFNGNIWILLSFTPLGL